MGAKLRTARPLLPRKSILIGVLVAAAILAGLSQAPSVTASGYWQSCYPPKVFLHASLRVHEVHCGKARRVIEGFMRKAQEQGPDVFVRGFHCVAVRESVSCRRGGQRIKLHGVAGRALIGLPDASKSQISCPQASALERPSQPRGAIPAAKEALGSKGRVLEVKRGPRSTYAAVAKRECGSEVLRDSIYVVVHPVGMTCSACNLHAYVVKFRDGPWKVWTAY